MKKKSSIYFYEYNERYTYSQYGNFNGSGNKDVFNDRNIDYDIVVNSH